MAEQEEEDHSYIRTAVTLGGADMINDWLTVEDNRADKALVTDMVLVPAAMYGQLRVLETALQYGRPLGHTSTHTYNSTNMPIILQT